MQYAMTTRTTGRTLDEGDPVAGTGFEYDPDGQIGTLLARRVGPLRSHPERGVWAARLPADDDTIRSVSLFEPGYDGPPQHYHEVSAEAFDVRRGEVELRYPDRTERVTSGERAAVPTGRRHTFASVGEELGVVITEISPAGRIGHVLPTFGGLAHDPAVDADSRLQRAVIADRLRNDTVFTESNPRLTRPLARLLAPLAKARGLDAAYGKYQQAAFWERHVEQPTV